MATIGLTRYCSNSRTSKPACSRSSLGILREGVSCSVKWSRCASPSSAFHCQNAWGQCSFLVYNPEFWYHPEFDPDEVEENMVNDYA